MKIWIYLNQTQQGPFAPEELTGMPGLTPDTLVWYEGLPKWCRAGDLELMQAILNGSYCGTETPSPDHLEDSVRVNTHEDKCQSDSESEDESYNSTEARRIPDDVVVDVSGRFYYAPHAAVNVTSGPASKCPPTYIGWSVFLIICCCSPVSLAALIASICVSYYYSHGNLAKARKASEWAVWLVMISIALGMIPAMLFSALF